MEVLKELAKAKEAKEEERQKCHRVEAEAEELRTRVIHLEQRLEEARRQNCEKERYETCVCDFVCVSEAVTVFLLQ
jgi:predicted  nucleic acid-binding Zn-ribbon protein